MNRSAMRLSVATVVALLVTAGPAIGQMVHSSTTTSKTTKTSATKVSGEAGEASESAATEATEHKSWAKKHHARSHHHARGHHKVAVQTKTTSTDTKTDK